MGMQQRRSVVACLANFAGMGEWKGWTESIPLSLALLSLPGQHKEGAEEGRSCDRGGCKISFSSSQVEGMSCVWKDSSPGQPAGV